MKYSVSADQIAYEEALMISTVHRSEAGEIVAAWGAVLDELRQDAHLKGERVHGRRRLRRIYQAPLWVYYLAEGTRVQLKGVRYSQP